MGPWPAAALQRRPLPLALPPAILLMLLQQLTHLPAHASTATLSHPGVPVVELQAVPFPLSAVRLQPGSRLQGQLEANTDWLMNLDVSAANRYLKC